MVVGRLVKLLEVEVVLPLLGGTPLVRFVHFVAVVCQLGQAYRHRLAAILETRDLVVDRPVIRRRVFLYLACLLCLLGSNLADAVAADDEAREEEDAAHGGDCDDDPLREQRFETVAESDFGVRPCPLDEEIACTDIRHVVPAVAEGVEVSLTEHLLEVVIIYHSRVPVGVFSDTVDNGDLRVLNCIDPHLVVFEGAVGELVHADIAHSKSLRRRRLQFVAGHGYNLV